MSSDVAKFALAVRERPLTTTRQVDFVRLAVLGAADALSLIHKEKSSLPALCRCARFLVLAHPGDLTPGFPPMVSDLDHIVCTVAKCLASLRKGYNFSHDVAWAIHGIFMYPGFCLDDAIARIGPLFKEDLPV